jgi:hypothetical protein
MMEAVSTTETSVNIYQTTRRNIPEDIHIQDHKMFGLTGPFTIPFGISKYFCKLRYFEHGCMALPQETTESTVIWTNLCVPRSLEVKGKGIRGVGGVAGKEQYTVHTINTISQRQYFVARRLSSCVGDVWFT